MVLCHNSQRQGGDRKLNPIGRFGSRLQCRHCRSESHLIRGFPTAPKVGLVRYVCDTAPDDALDITPREILDAAQDTQEEEYAVCLATVEPS